MDGKLRSMSSIYISSNGKMLLLYRIGSRVVAPSWCGVGGHFEKDELSDARACALRELNEEIRIGEQDLQNLCLRYVTLRLTAGEIRHNYYFFAQLMPDARIELTCDEGVLEWVDYPQVLNRPMPHTAEHVLRHYMAIGKNTDCLYAGIAVPDGVNFTELAKF